MRRELKDMLLYLLVSTGLIILLNLSADYVAAPLLAIAAALLFWD